MSHWTIECGCNDHEPQRVAPRPKDGAVICPLCRRWHGSDQFVRKQADVTSWKHHRLSPGHATSTKAHHAASDSEPNTGGVGDFRSKDRVRK